MNAARLEERVSQLTGVTLKIYNAVPLSSHWGVGAIAGEIKRVVGSAPSFDIIRGALNSLTEQGLLTNNGDLWMRVSAKPKITTITPITGTQAVPQNKYTAPDVQLNLSEKLLVIAEALKRRAKELEDLAIDVDIALTKPNGELEELRAFKATLKGLFS